ncbi:MAG: hypothetical protein ACXW29_04510 [Thermoanaerobaculia bacterium]
MINCDSFRARFVPATDDPAVLEHLRTCDACLSYSLEIDGDSLFRSLGGDQLIPEGGVDAFVDDVMREVRLRGTEHTFASRDIRWPRKLAVAATLAAVISGGAFIYEHNQNPNLTAPPGVAHMKFPAASKPIIENYDSQQATIVEVPTEGEDVKVVMVFDDSLPADL